MAEAEEGRGQEGLQGNVVHDAALQEMREVSNFRKHTQRPKPEVRKGGAPFSGLEDSRKLV